GGVRGGLFVLNSVLLLSVMLRQLGTAQFALFALVYPFLRFGFTGAFDPGLTVALSRRVSMAWATESTQAICEEFTAAAALFALLLPLLALLAVWASPALARALLRGQPLLWPLAA